VSLLLRYERTKQHRDLQEATAAWREACTQGLDAAPDLVLELAVTWGERAKRQPEPAWAEAGEAFGYGLDAVERLVQVQLDRPDKEARLWESKGLPAAAAEALARAGSPERAVLSLERGRAALLTESLERWRADLSRLRQDHPELAERYDTAAAQMRELESRAANSAAPLPTMAQQHAARTALDQVIADIQQLRGYEDFLARPAFGRVADVASTVPLVYLSSTDEEGLALIVGPGRSVEALWLPQLTRQALRQQVASVHERGAQLAVELAQENFARGWRPEDALRDAVIKAGMKFLPKVTRWLWDAVMGPLLTSDLPLSRMVLAPSGLLGVWPLHAAWTEDATTPTGRRYALDEACITYAPNARMLRQAQLVAARATADSLLVIQEPQPVKRAAPLPFAGLEAQAAMTAFRRSRTQALRRDNATRQNVLAALPGYSVVHFCCHGNADPDNPLDSGLLMVNDEQLTVADIMRQRLAEPRLAILSACETNLPGLKMPDEAVSLPTVMLHAGFGAVIGSLQKVPDSSTMVLMTRFYDLWRTGGVHPPEALRQAQRWVRDSTVARLRDRFPDVLPSSSDNADETQMREVRPFTHEIFWAAFAYVGA
jgi:hypothetical protein